MSSDASGTQGVSKKKFKGIKGVIAGAITGSIEIRITFPVEYVKILLQLDGEGQTRKYNGMLHVIRHTVKRHGFVGLYRGIELMVYTAPAKSAIRFGVFEQTKQHLVNEKGKLTPTRKMICGLAAGTIEGIAVITPTETLKVKFINDRSLEKPKYKGLLHGVRSIYKEYGARGIYRGVTPTVARQGTNQAVRFYMMETMKERYNGGDTSKHIPKYVIATFGAFSGQTRKYNGMLHVIRHTVKRHGFVGLYRGIELMVYTAPAKSAIRFGVFEQTKQHLVNEKGKLTPTRKMICGLAAGTIEGIAVITPTETLKVKFINDRSLEKPKYKGLLHGVRSIYKEYGARGIYRGVTPTVARQGTNQAVRFYMMETMKERYNGGDTSKHIPKYVIATFGAFSGACSCYVTAPIDVVKTRMQSLYTYKYNNSLDCLKKIWIREGLSSFYKGSVPRLCRNMIDVAISFTIYDTINELLEQIIVV